MRLSPETGVLQVRRLLLLLIGPLLLVAAPAYGADDVASLPDGTYTYQGTVKVVQDSGPGPGNYTEAQSSEIRCRDGRCTIRFESRNVAIDAAGRWRATAPDTYRCNIGGPPIGRGAVTFSGTVTPTSIKYTFRQATAVDGSCTYSGFTATYRGSRVQAADELAPVEPTPAAEAPEAPEAQPAVSSTDREVGTGASRLDSGDADAPSVLSALQQPEDVTAENVLLGIALAVVLVLLVAFPTTLLNSAAESGSDRVSAWWRGDAGVEARPGRWRWAASGVALAGLIAAFVDPEFGFNLGSVRVLLSILTSFAVETALGWLVVAWAVRRVNPGAEASYSFKPATLLVVAALVAFVRVADFEPGIIFGLVAGVAFPAVTSKTGLARNALVSVGWAYLVGIAAWFGYAALGSPSGATQVFASETFSAMAVAGMAALPIALFPVRGLLGSQLFAADRRLWAGAYAVGLASFFVVLMPAPFAWDEIAGTLKAWVGIYLAYLVVAVLAWSVVRTKSDEDADVDHGVRPDALDRAEQ